MLFSGVFETRQVKFSCLYRVQFQRSGDPALERFAIAY